MGFRPRLRWVVAVQFIAMAAAFGIVAVPFWHIMALASLSLGPCRSRASVCGTAMFSVTGCGAAVGSLGSRFSRQTVASGRARRERVAINWRVVQHLEAQFGRFCLYGSRNLVQVIGLAQVYPSR